MKNHPESRLLTNAGRGLLDRRLFLADTSSTLSAIALAGLLADQDLLAKE
ncbi:MAG: hypothetical protein ACI93T_004501, partial [Porticoccaceae bacterium]